MPVNKKPNQERDTAEQLKALGNEFYQKGRYEDAYKTYSDAIKKDPNNAVLYANRAATCLSMKE
jgi:tetratricopeptide (TPR) repeat protein